MVILTTGQSAENMWQWSDQPQMGYLYITPSPHLRDYQGRGGGKAENQKSAGPECNSVFWTWQDCYTCEVTAAAVGCTRWIQDQASQHSSKDREGSMSPQPNWGARRHQGASRGGQSIVFKSVTLGSLTAVKGMASHPGIYQQPKLELLGYFSFKRSKRRKVGVGR